MVFSISPEGYVVQKQDHCQIALEAGAYNEIKLGHVFLKHLYTGLSYADDKVLLGLRKGNTMMKIQTDT